MEPVTHGADAHFNGPSSARASPRTQAPWGGRCRCRRHSACRHARHAAKTRDEIGDPACERAIAISARRACPTQDTYA
jgi:hypothetical protein